MISRCSEARERTVNRSEWSGETTTDDTTAGYRRTPATSIDAMRTVFLVGTPGGLPPWSSCEECRSDGWGSVGRDQQGGNSGGIAIRNGRHPEV
jgi:hypothetical protein